MALFECVKPEEFLLFIWKFQITIKAPGTLAVTTKINYLRTMVRGKVLRQLDILSREVGSTATEHLNLIILGLGTDFPPGNALSKKKREMCHGMRKPCGLKVRLCAYNLIYIN